MKRLMGYAFVAFFAINMAVFAAEGSPSQEVPACQTWSKAMEDLEIAGDKDDYQIVPLTANQLSIQERKYNATPPISNDHFTSGYVIIRKSEHGVRIVLLIGDCIEGLSDAFDEKHLQDVLEPGEKGA